MPDVYVVALLIKEVRLINSLLDTSSSAIRHYWQTDGWAVRVDDEGSYTSSLSREEQYITVMILTVGKESRS